MHTRTYVVPPNNLFHSEGNCYQVARKYCFIEEMKRVQFSHDWQQILLQCKENVAGHIQPMLRTACEPQPDLGIGAGGDHTKLVDVAAENAIVEVLLQHEISFTLVSEEAGIKEYGAQPKTYYVTIDPIDGTTNFTRGLPFYCSSVAVSDKPILSAVFAAMVTDLVHANTYIAERNKGAQCNGRKITTSQTAQLDEAVVGVDLNTYKAKEIAPQLSEFIAQTKHIRHFGANALELCFVAEGLTDAFVDLRGKLRTTDVAAGFLVLKEAGGIVTDAAGQQFDVPLDPKQTVKFVASGNPQIHNAILSTVKRQ
jgi:myo-inositol-1(or 4)-monophosphatase